MATFPYVGEVRFGHFVYYTIGSLVNYFWGPKYIQGPLHCGPLSYATVYYKQAIYFVLPANCSISGTLTLDTHLHYEDEEHTHNLCC